MEQHSQDDGGDHNTEVVSAILAAVQAGLDECQAAAKRCTRLAQLNLRLMKVRPGEEGRVGRGI